MMAVGLNVVVGYSGPARPRLRRLLRGRRLHRRLVRLRPVRAGRASTSARSGISPDVRGHPHLVLARPPDRRAASPRSTGILIGLPTLRLRGDYLAIVTLGFGEIIPQVVRNGDDFGGFNLTNGTFGINPIDSPGFGETLNDTLGLPVAYRPSFERERLFYWTILALLLITVFCCVRLRDSRLGRAWIAIREDETAAAAMGVPLMRTKTWAYAIGAFFGGIAGAFFASFKSGAFPSDFYFNISIFLLCMVILGGMGSVWGVVAGGSSSPGSTSRGSPTSAAKFNDARRHGHRDREVPVRDLRRDHRADDALPADGADPRAAAQAGARRGRARRVAVRGLAVTAAAAEARRRGADPRRGRRVRKEFGGLVAVNDVDFTIPRRSIVSLIGPNGAGKTTFFNMLTGVYTPTRGTDRLRRHDITGKPPHAITELGVGRTFQNIRLFEQMTALENVLVGMHSRLKGGILGAILGTPRVRREERDARRAGPRAAALLRPSRPRRRARREPPYGDQRRLEVARALATEPKLLLLDEPTAGMNPQETAVFTDFVGRLREERA